MVSSVIELNSCFSQLNAKSFSILTLKLPFWKCVTYALGCSFMKSSLLRRIFILRCQLNTIKQHAWWIKKSISKKKRFQICDGAFLWKQLTVTGVIQAKVEVGHRVSDSWVLDPKLPNSRNTHMIQINKRAKTK